jgi:hypothetical protein
LVELTSEMIEDAGRNAGIIQQKPSIAAQHAKLKSEAQAMGFSPTVKNLPLIFLGKSPIPREFFLAHIRR